MFGRKLHAKTGLFGAFFTVAVLVVEVFAATSEWPFVAGPVLARFAIEVRADWDAVQPAGDGLRIASYNIQDFTDAVDDGPDRTPGRMYRQAALAAAIIGEIAPDVLVMQEIENEEALSALNDMLPEPYPLAYITRFSDGGGRDLNIAVLSKVMLSGVRELNFSRLRGPGRPPRGVLSFTVNLGGRHKLLVYGVHLKSNWGDTERNVAKRYSAIQLVADDAQQIRDRHPGFEWEMIVLGDVNVDPDLEQFAEDRSLEPLDGWRDLWRGRPLEERTTIPTRFGDPALEFPQAAFDRFFTSPELSASPWVVSEPMVVQRGVDTQNVLVVGGENELHASDHYPVYVDLKR